MILSLALLALVATVLETILLAGPVRYADTWAWWWVWPALWQVLYAAVLLGVAVLLRPNSNNPRFAYSSLNDEESEFDDGDVALEEMGVAVHQDSVDSDVEYAPAGGELDVHAVDPVEESTAVAAETGIRTGIIVEEVHSGDDGRA
jgi:hypothetical protein